MKIYHRLFCFGAIAVSFYFAIISESLILFAQSPENEYSRYMSALYESQKTDGFSKTLRPREWELLRLQQWDAVIDQLEKNHPPGNEAEECGLLGHAYYGKSMIRHERETPIRALFRYIYRKRAIKSFGKAIELDHGNLNWHYSLAMVYLTQNDEQSLRKASEQLLQIRMKDKNFHNTAFLLGVVYRRLNEIEKSELTFEEFLESRPDPHAMLEMVRIHMTRNEVAEAEKYYKKALDNLYDQDAVELIMSDMRFLLTRQERGEFDETEDKGMWLKRFWLARDPTPRTPENERTQEHLRRVHYAQEFFSSPGARARYDARGEIYIKYGLPSYRYQDGGSDRVYQNESWTYDWNLTGNKDGLVFDFANEPGFGFRLITDLRHAFVSNWTPFDLMQLYRDREDVNVGYYASVSHSSDFIDFIDKFRNLSQKKLYAYRKAPAQVFNYAGFPEKMLPIFLQDATFRAEGGLTQYEISYGFQLNDIHFVNYEQSSHSSLIREVTIRNSRADELFHDRTIIDLSFSRNEKLDDKTYIGQVRFNLSPQEEMPMLHFSLNDPRDDRLGLYFYELENRDYSGEALLVSDIKFSYKITPARDHDEYFRRGVRIEPYLSTTLEKHKPVQVYFEIYNLSPDAYGKGRCTVQYMVERELTNGNDALTFYDRWGKLINHPGQTSFISISNELETRGTEHGEYTTIDLSGLRDGIYNFVVRVTDFHTNQSSEASRIITLASGKTN